MEATEELTVMTGDKDDEETRLAVAREDACPWLGRILATFIGLRFGDDVLDIALIALGVLGELGADFIVPVDEAGPGFLDGVTENDITFNDVFPYAATPLNGRVHGHHGTDDGS